MSLALAVEAAELIGQAILNVRRMASEQEQVAAAKRMLAATTIEDAADAAFRKDVAVAKGANKP